MQIDLKKISQSPFIWTCLLFVGIYSTVGFHYEEGTDSVVIVTISSIFKDVTDNFINTFGFHFVTSHLFKFFYRIIPAFPWYDCFMGFCLFIATFNVFKLSKKISKEAGIFLLFKIALLIILLVLWLDNLLLVQITRTAFLLAVSASFLIVEAVWSGRWNRRNILLWNLMMVLALFTRAEPIYLLLALLVPFWYLLSRTAYVPLFSKLIKAHALFLTAIVLTSIFLNIPMNEEDEYYMTIRPYQFTLWDFEQPGLDIQLVNKKDSVIYWAAKRSFLTDKKEINAAFFEKINLNPLDKSPTYLFNYLKDWRSIPLKLTVASSKIWTKHFLLILVVLGISLVIGSWLLLKSQKKVFINFFLFQVVFWGLLMAVAALMKMEDRVLEPMLLINFLGTLLFFGLPFSKIQNSNKSIKSVLLTVLIICGMCAIVNFKNTIKAIEERADLATYIQYLKSEMGQRLQGKQAVINLWTMDRLFIRLFESHSLPEGIQYFSVDNGILFIHRSYEQYMERVAGAVDFEKVMQYFLENERETVFISSENRMNLLTEYANTVYGLNITSIKISEDLQTKFLEQHMDFIPGHPIDFYRIEKVVPIQ